MVIPYTFLAIESITRFLLIYVSKIDFSAYGELSYIFITSSFLGSLLSFGAGQEINFNKRSNAYAITILLYMSIVGFVAQLLFNFLSPFTYSYIFYFGFLYPIYNLVASRSNLFVNVILRFQKASIWFIFLLIIFGNKIWSYIFLIPLTLNILLFTYISTNKSKDLLSVKNMFSNSVNIKFFISSVSNNFYRFFERTMALIFLPDPLIFGKFQALRDLTNIPVFLLSPILTERALAERGIAKLMNYIYFFSLSGFIIQAFFLASLAEGDILLFFLVIFCTIGELFKSISILNSEVKNNFFNTYKAKAFLSLSLLSLFAVQVININFLLIFLGLTHFATSLWLTINNKKGLEN